MFNLNINLVVVALLVISIYPGQTNSEQPFNVQQLKLTSPVVFEAVENAVFYSDTWTIFTKFTPLDSGMVIQMVEKCEQKLETLCRSIPDDDFKRYCQLIAQETETNIDNLRRTAFRMKQLTHAKRQKRALEFIGGFSKWAFGTMDSKDARSVYHQLEVLHKQDASSFELMHRQLSVMKSNFDTLSKPISQLTDEIENMAVSMGNLSATFRTYSQVTNKEIAMLKATSEATAMTSVITTKVLEVQNRQSLELSILDDLYQNKIHPLVLDEGNITGLLRNITSKGRFLLDNPLIINQVAKTSVYLDGGNFMVKIILPLPEYVRYKVQKIYPLPTPFNENWDLVLDTKHEYIAEAENHDRFVIMSETEYAQCAMVLTGGSLTRTAICRHERPILTSGSNECLVELIQHAPSSKNSCKYAAIPATEAIFLKMTSANEWLFKVKETMSLNVKCETQNYAVTLSDSGILQMKQPCEAIAKGFKLFYEFHAEAITEYKQPMVDHSGLKEALLRKVSVSKSAPVPELLPIKIGNHKNFANILNEGKKSIDDLIQSWDGLEAERKADSQDWELSIHRYSMMSFVSLVAVVTAVVFLIRCLRKGPPTIPAQRKYKANSEVIEMPAYLPKRRAPVTRPPPPPVQTVSERSTVYGVTSARV